MQTCSKQGANKPTEYVQAFLLCVMEKPWHPAVTHRGRFLIASGFNSLPLGTATTTYYSSSFLVLSSSTTQVINTLSMATIHPWRHARARMHFYEHGRIGNVAGGEAELLLTTTVMPLKTSSEARR